MDGAAGTDGGDGADGDDGWSPTFAIASDGARRVLEVDDWTGGTGTKPATGQYVGATGLVNAIASGVDIRGPQGGGGGTGSEASFSTVLNDVSDLGTSFATLAFDSADININEGGFTTASNNAMVSEDGRYLAIATVYGTGPSSSNRARIEARFAVTSGGTETAQAERVTSYSRGSYTGFDTLSVILVVPLDLSDGDGVAIQARSVKQTGSTTVTVTGATSRFTLLKLGGTKGDAGAAGATGRGRGDGRHGCGRGRRSPRTAGRSWHGRHGRHGRH